MLFHHFLSSGLPAGQQDVPTDGLLRREASDKNQMVTYLAAVVKQACKLFRGQ